MSKIDELFERTMGHEGGAQVSNDPADPGGRTQFGVSERAHPSAWADGRVTEQEAREIFINKYVIGPKYHTIPPSHKHTQAQLVDWGYNSGPGIATQNLQEQLNEQVKPNPRLKVDGLFGPKSLAALLAVDDQSINNLLVAARVRMVGRVVQRNPAMLKFLVGLLSRALSFMK